MDILTTEHLSKYYGCRLGVRDLSLSVPEGTLCGFLGPNGAGKSTTIRVLLGLLRPTAGGARIFDLDCWRRSHRIKEEVGYLPGDLRLYPWLTPRGALGLFGRIRRRDMLTRGRRLADEFELDLDTRAANMSRGNRQKLGLILAMAHQPRLLILDEPMISLDPLIQEKVKTRLKDAAAKGQTVFFSSHTLGDVERLCRRVIILRAGRVVASASIEDLRRRARREVVIRWKKDSRNRPASPPAGLEMLQREEFRWRCALSGPVDELIAWLACLPVEDLFIAPPDIESLFRAFYRE